MKLILTVALLGTIPLIGAGISLVRAGTQGSGNSMLMAQAQATAPKQDATSRPSDPGMDALRRNKPMSLNQNDLAGLVKNSKLIFIGRLVDKKVERDQRGLIITRNYFQRERIIAGSSNNQRITLTTLGGTLDGETMSVSHMPMFEKGRRYIIFTDPNRTTYDPITGNENGVFLVDPKSSSVYTYDGISVVGVDKGALRLGRQMLEADSQHSPGRSSSVMGNPTQVRGNIISIEQAPTRTSAAESVISLEQFVKSILSLASS